MGEELQKIAVLVDEKAHIFVRNSTKNPWCVVVNMRFEHQEEALLVMTRFPSRMVSQEKNGKIYYWLNYDYKKAVALIQKILPFLVKQRAQAICVVDLENFKSLSRKQKQTEEVKIVRAQLLEKLNSENKALLKQRMGDAWKENY